MCGGSGAGRAGEGKGKGITMLPLLVPVVRVESQLRRMASLVMECRRSCHGRCSHPGSHCSSDAGRDATVRARTGGTGRYAHEQPFVSDRSGLDLTSQGEETPELDSRGPLKRQCMQSMRLWRSTLQCGTALLGAGPPGPAHARHAKPSALVHAPSPLSLPRLLMTARSRLAC